jgi:ABC-type phosphate/phosphonate transport system substrate-binding protein
MDVQGADEAIRVLVRFGAIPGDVVAARTQLTIPRRDTLTRALLAISREPEHRLLLSDAFGIDEFRRWVSAGYDALRRLAEDASKRGLLEGNADEDEDDLDEEDLDDDNDDQDGGGS